MGQSMYFQNQRRATVLQSTIRALLFAAGTVAVSAAAIQSAAAQAQTSPESRRYQIPAGPLTQTLGQFVTQSGVSVTASSSLTDGKTSPGLTGTYSITGALSALLQGTGLEAFDQGDGAYVLRVASPAAAATEQTMQKVRVVSAEETGTTEGTRSLTTPGPVAAATGLNLSLRETPQSVTVITRERIDQQSLNSLADIAEQVTGVYYNSRGTPIGGRTLMYARGYEVDSYQIDGVNVPWETLAESERYGHGSLDTAIYDSVTVVRGSTGLMTGAGDPSALMALTRKKPTHELQTSFEATLGSWDHYRLMADVGGPLNASGSLRGRVVAAYDQGDSWVDDYSNDRSVFYGAFEADLGERTLLRLTLEHGTADSKGAPWAEDYGSYFYFDDGVTPMPKSTSTNISPHWSYLNSDRTYASATLEHRFNDDWSATFTYGFGKFNTDMRRGMVNSIPEDGSPVIARLLSLDFNYDTHIVDVRVDGKYRLFGREHDLVVGLNMYRNDQAAPLSVYDDFRGFGYSSASWSNGRLRYTDPDWNAMPGSEADYPYDIDTRQEGAYVATRLRPMDRLSVILGGRITNWEYFYAERATANHDSYVYSDLDYNNEFTPYAGVVVDLTDALSAYASYTQIFKPQEKRDVSGNLLEPEEGDTYELGLKGAWFEGRLNASAAVFESKRNNLGVALRDAEGPILTPNGDQAYSAEDHTEGRGWEIEVAGELTPNWQIQAGYTRFKNEDSAGDVLNPEQPEQQFKLFTQYRPEALSKLSVGGSLRWQDDTAAVAGWGTGNPDFDNLDSYVVVGVNLGYELNEQVSLSLLVNNVLDEEYRVSSYSHSYGAPRSATFSVRARF
ncbi:MAG TPA: TonB-dependent siderophore receptor [Povalibacter sp.]|nr:TonB-dependent siderophore receptor [Povalibacter sp.]